LSLARSISVANCLSQSRNPAQLRTRACRPGTATLAGSSWAVRGHRRPAGVHEYFCAWRSDRDAGNRTCRRFAPLSAHIRTLRGTAATSGTLERAADVLQDLGKELNKPKEAATTFSVQPTPTGLDVKLIPVEVRQPPPTALESIAAFIAPLLRPLTATGIFRHLHSSSAL
jgi:hypothetical protein